MVDTELVREEPRPVRHPTESGAEDDARVILFETLDGTSNHLMVNGRPTNIIAVHPVWGEIQRIMEALTTMPHAKKPKVLIAGETGTGKELIARALHTHSAAPGRFVGVNCHGIPDTLIESELFGHEKGSFTGAYATKKGLFEAANGGTILLDEIEDTSPAFQAKLLRVLQERTIKRVGGTEEIDIRDLHIVCATNQNLQEAIANKKFRDDLYYRIGVITIDLPPLRSRTDDIPALVAAFVENHDGGKKPRGITAGALTALKQHNWPGNVRELENVMERILTFSGEKEIIELADIPDDIRNPPRSRRLLDLRPVAGTFDESLAGAPRILDEIGRVHTLVLRLFYEAMLRRARENISRLSEALGIDRSNLRRTLERLGIRHREDPN